MSNQYPTHTQRNHHRADAFAQRKQQPTLDAQADHNHEWLLKDVLFGMGRDLSTNPAKVVTYNTLGGGKGWSLNGGESGRGRVILRVDNRSLENAYHIALAAKDAGYHIINPDILTA